jgi:hypothetical protein
MVGLTDRCRARMAGLPGARHATGMPLAVALREAPGVTGADLGDIMVMHDYGGRSGRDLGGPVAALATEVEELLRATAAYGSVDIEAARSRVRRRLDELRQSVEPAAGATRWREAVVGRARANPALALTLVGLAGALAGWCAGRHLHAHVRRQ